MSERIDPESLTVGQTLWFIAWLDTEDRNVIENDIHRAAVYSATIESIELMAIQRVIGGVDSKEFYVNFKENHRGLSLWVGDRAYQNQRLYLSYEDATLDARKELAEDFKQAKDRVTQTVADLQIYQRIVEEDIPILRKEAADEGFTWRTVMAKQVELEGAK